jgi:hypothetical protein
MISKKIHLKILSLALIFLVNLYFVPLVTAAPLSLLSDTMTRLKISQTSDHTIKLTTPSGITTGQTVTLTFPSTSFTMGGTLTGVTINGSAVTSATWSAPTLTITASGTSTVAPGGVATIVIPNAQITNPSTEGTYIIEIGGTFGDTGRIAVAIITDDQIPVTAAVNPTISLTVANTILALGILDSGSISTTGYNNITVGTNGSGGYSVTVKGQGNNTNPGLYNSGANKLIPSSTATLAAGTEGYGGQCNKISGDGVCNIATAGENVTGLAISPVTFASYGSKPVGTDTFQIRVKAAVSTATDAGSYADTLTIIGTANF